MNHPKKLNLLLAICCLLQMPARSAEKQDAPAYPQFFIALQGGAQQTFTDYSAFRLTTPTASISIGSFFTPVVGVRLHLNGIWNKGGYKDDDENFRYKYRYLTSDVDVLVNLVTLIGRKNSYPMNVYLTGGIGLCCAWNNGEALARTDFLPLAFEGKCISHNARIGTMLEWNVSKAVGINLEVAANNLKDRFNSKMSKKPDWQLTTQIGIIYRFRIP